MSAESATTEGLQILLACARPMAARMLKLHVKFRTQNGWPEEEAVKAVSSLLTDRLKLALLGGEMEHDHVTFHLSEPLPERAYLESEVMKSEAVLAVSLKTDGGPVDVHRPGEERKAVLNGLSTVAKAVEVSVADTSSTRICASILTPIPAATSCIFPVTETNGGICFWKTAGAGRAMWAAGNWPRSWAARLRSLCSAPATASEVSRVSLHCPRGNDRP